MTASIQSKFRFSLKQRIWLVLSAVMGLAILGSTVVQLHQNRASTMSMQVVSDARKQIIFGTNLLEAVSEIDRKARSKESYDWEVRQFRLLLSNFSVDLGENMNSDELRGLLTRIDAKFKVYRSALERLREASPDSDPTTPVWLDRANNAAIISDVHNSYEDLTSDIAMLIRVNEDGTLRTWHQLRSWRESTSNLTYYLLAMLVLMTFFGGFMVVGAITEPLSSLVKFLDQVNIEDDLPMRVPLMNSDIPEISLVAKSFEQLLQRLSVYRSLNVKRLLIEKKRADIIAASISDGIFLLRGEEILYTNPVGEQMLSVRNPVGKNIKDLAVPGTSQTNRCARAILSSVSQAMPVEFSAEREEEKLHYLIQTNPISFDLIEQVESESRRTGVEDDPIHRIVGRFQATTLVIAQDVTLVRESQDAKSHFLGTLSHEIKTPVTSLTMATRLLNKKIEEISNPVHRSLILTCVEDVDRLRRLLDDLLTVSRFETLTQRLTLQNVDFTKLLKNAVQSYQLQARERGVALEFRIFGKDGEDIASGKNLMLMIDATKISWAISNLLINALRHTPREGIVSVELITAHADSIEVKVKDTGPGIERKRQGRIFDKFSPFYDIRVARSGSVGVGLSIAREIITAHGGRIWVSSEVGQGAEFCFTIPYKHKKQESDSVNGLNNLNGLTTGDGLKREEKGLSSGAFARS